MYKFKTIIAVLVISAIITTCTLAASATLSFNTSVYWGPLDRSAWAETVANGTTGLNVLVTAYILSRSTGDYEEKFVPSYNSGPTVTATTDPVSVTYPTDLPPVYYGGSCMFIE